MGNCLLLVITTGVVVLKGVLIGVVATAVLSLALRGVFRANRLFFWCILAALAVHLSFAGVLLAAGSLFQGKTSAPPSAVHVKLLPPPPEMVKPDPPRPKLDPPVFKIQQGVHNGDPTTKVMPKGHTLDPDKAGDEGDGKEKDKSKSVPLEKLIARLDDREPDILIGTEIGVTNTDITEIVNRSNKGGRPGSRLGTPDGHGDGPLPWGDENGDPNGRVYFIRLKHGTGAWNAYDDGIQRLLAYLNKYFTCERESRPMTAAQIRERLMNRGIWPAFIYLYADDTFTLSTSEANILRAYLEKDGFLFIDSRPDPAIKERVAREMDKVLPGAPLADISKKHPINSYLFRLAQPGVGINTVTQKNYGITRNGRLAVFYTMGNFGYLYSAHEPESMEYITAQYQMGANVMLYAIEKGNPEKMKGLAGANASISTLTPQACEQLGLLDPAPKPAPKTGTVKVQPDKGSKPSVNPPGPDEIELLE